ncbi:hypothetical protein H5410_036025 [Solanum commersonii]|uniref:Protein YIP n=1 Tax=Solanum commersonii TaxID=4109 RepID=A0A9J5Y2Z0_SOLCO|nr:hypothetical protein H5410_036025 [Solanum commersonii]
MQLILIEEPTPIQYDPSECNNEVESDATSWVQQNRIKLSKEFGAIFNGLEKDAELLFERLDQRREMRSRSGKRREDAMGGNESEVFAVAFALLAAGAVILTLNVLLLGGHIIFFQSLSLLGYCLFPLDVGAFICMLKDNVILKVVVVCVALAWSSWAAYPFMSTAANPRRKALALYPVVLMYHCFDQYIWFASAGHNSTNRKVLEAP